jgi:hypothetical protein
MIELRNRLEQIAGPVTRPSASQAEADLARGRRALRRRRAGQLAAGSAFAVTALAAAIALGNDYSGSSPATQVAAPPPSVTDSTTTGVAPRLVAYNGNQPKGFTIDKVPEGWEIQGVDRSSLTLAPKGMADRDFHHFVGKIAVMLQSWDEHSVPAGIPVQVGDKPGVLVVDKGGSGPRTLPTANASAIAHDGATLWVKLPSGVHLQVQVWEGLGFSQDAIVELAAGIHVQPDAVRGHG